MKLKLKQLYEQSSSILKYVYIIHIILVSSSVLVETPLTKITSGIVLLFAAMTLLQRLIHFKQYKSYPLFWIYVLFLGSFILSSVLNISYGWTSNAKILIWMCIWFGGLVLFDPNRDEAAYRTELKHCLILIIVMSCLLNLVSFGMLLGNYWNYRKAAGRSYIIGVAWWGRLYGVHTDPNYAAVVASIGLMSALYLYLKSTVKKHRRWLGAAILIELTNLAFGASRTGTVTICMALFLFFLIRSMLKHQKLMKSILTGLLAAVIALGSEKVLTLSYNGYVTIRSALITDTSSDEQKDKLTKIGREEELSGDISNRRFDLWQNALEFAEENPITGVSFGNFVEYAKEKAPDSYIITNSFMTFDAFHNMFMDLLASQGILGVVIFLALIIMSLRRIWKTRLDLSEDDKMLCAFLFSTCMAVGVSSMFVSEILYVNNQCTVLFWLLWGYLMYFVHQGRKAISK